MSTMPGGRGRVRAENDVFTALLLISTLVALGATVYIGYRAMSLFDTVLPPGGG